MGAARKLLDEALALPADEREALIEALSESLQPVALSPEWQVEVERRISAIERGETELVAWEDVHARLRAELAGS